MSFLHEYIEGFIGLIFPKLCLACASEQPVKGDPFCISCSIDLPVTLHFSQEENDFNYHFRGRVPILFGGALLNYYKDNMVKGLLHKLKYQGKSNVGTLLGERLGKELVSSPFFKKPDIIIPVPLHRKRANQRGYNQSQIIAKGMLKHIDVQLVMDALVKTKHTKSLTKQTRSDRTMSLLDSLAVKNSSSLEYKHILLVDDVLTTGATLEACALKLLEVPGVEISMTTLAITKS